MADLKFYYKNVTADVIGPKHGITDKQFEQMGQDTSPLITRLNDERKQGLTAYRDLPYNDNIVKDVTAMAGGLSDCENFVVLGIGGSALGNIALQTALNPYMYNIDAAQRTGPRFFVFDNVDPAQLGSFLKWIGPKLDRTVFNVISKSGRTAETASQLMTVIEMLKEKLGANALKDHLIATTDREKGTLRNIANTEKLRCLEVPDGVGGRFSVLSAVGLLGAAVCGIDIESLMAGARDMDERVSNEDFFLNPAALNAAINVYYYNTGKKNSVMMPYCYGLKDFADWYRQLWAESLGKAVDLKGASVNVGPTPIKALGTTDQHSQVQLYREGPNDKLFTFLQVNKFDRDVKIGPAPGYTPELEFLSGRQMADLINSEKAGTEYALLHDSRPCLTVCFDEITPYTVGQFIYLFEATTSFAGTMFNINTYDQPAVELGKEATFALMGRDDFKDLAGKIKPFTAIDGKYLI